MQRYIFIILLSIFSSLHLYSQGQFALHLDKPFYTTGEEIWYKLYLPVNLPNSVAIKGIIVTPNGQVAERFFHRSNPNQSYIDGYFKIPFSYRSGMHRIEFRATGSPSEPEIILVEMEFPLYNDFQLKELSEQMASAPKDLGTNSAVPGQLKVDIQLNKATFSKREQVNAQVNVTEANAGGVPANLSIASVDASLVYDALPNAPTVTIGPMMTQAQINSLKGKIFVKGQVYDTLDNPIKANVLGAYASVQKRIHYGKTDAQGFFTFEIPDFYGQQTLQFIGYPKEVEEIRVKLQSETEGKAAPSKKLPINDKILQYLEASQQKKKMAEHFESLNTAIEMDKAENEFEGLKADFSYVADEYVKFENIGDFFGELITPLKFRIVKGVYEARMENPRARDASFNNLPGKPLFIIDGKVTRDANFIARTSWSNVKTIDIFYIADKLRKQFNILAQGGVVRIFTDIPQFELPENDLEDVFTVDGLKPGGTYVPFEPGSRGEEVRIPNFNMPAYWSADQATARGGDATVSFFNGDEASNYRITVIAQGADGKLGFATQNYSVK